MCVLEVSEIAAVRLAILHVVTDIRDTKPTEQKKETCRRPMRQRKCI